METEDCFGLQVYFWVLVIIRVSGGLHLFDWHWQYNVAQYDQEKNFDKLKFQKYYMFEEIN
jgi:hypothetical protein